MATLTPEQQAAVARAQARIGATQAPRPSAPAQPRDMRPEPARRQQEASTTSTQTSTARTAQTTAQSAQSFPYEMERLKAEAERAKIEVERLRAKEAAGELDLKEQQSLNASRAILMAYGETLYRNARAGGYEPTTPRNRIASLASGLPIMGENLADFIRDPVSERGVTGERRFTEGALRTATGAGGPKEERPQTTRNYFPTPWQSLDPEARKDFLATRLEQLSTSGRVAGPALGPSARATISALSSPPKKRKDESASTKLPRVKNNADYAALPSGTKFIDPDGNTRTKP